MTFRKNGYPTKDVKKKKRKKKKSIQTNLVEITFRPDTKINESGSFRPDDLFAPGRFAPESESIRPEK